MVALKKSTFGTLISDDDECFPFLFQGVQRFEACGCVFEYSEKVRNTTLRKVANGVFERAEELCFLKTVEHLRLHSLI